MRWSIAWKNWHGLKGMNAEEYVFAWKLQQDMLLIGARLHRPYADRRCKLNLTGDRICQEYQTRQHMFIECESVGDIFYGCTQVVTDLLQKEVSDNDIVHLSFNHRNKGRLKCVLWFVVKLLYKIYLDRARNKNQLFLEVLKELEWNIKLNRKIGSQIDMFDMKRCIEIHLGIIIR